MADALISSITSELIRIISSPIQQEYRLVVGVTKEIEKLRSNFITIQAVLEDAERRQIKDSAVRLWLDELKQVCYDMEDVLADWSTEIHEWEIKEADAKATAADKSKLKVRFFAGCCSPLNQCFNQVKRRHDIAHKIKNICERLDEIDKNKSSYNLTVYSAPAEEHERPITSKSRVTTSHVDASKMRGRDDDKKKLIDKLLCNIEQSTREIPIVSIIGAGGIGKTTLAQLAYNDEKVKAHFQERIWICVSEPFDKVNIAREIIRKLDNSSPFANSNQLDLLLDKISELVNEKRILLVLDDVWNENPNEWEQLKLSLGCANPQSRILVTTRKDNVAKVMGTTYFLPIGLLSDDECWLVFRQLAFSGRSEDEYKRLEDIGRKIVVEKVKGLPLAANIVGGLMQFKMRKREWEDVLSSNLWELKDVDTRLFGPLLLSYYDLPTAMRRCFTYCAMFPKDTRMRKSVMIRMWMAQGYLNKATSSKEMKLVGEEYFDNLVVRSFFQNLEESDEDGIKDMEFKMHDIVHDSAQILSGNECFSCTGKEIRTKSCINERVRHLSLLSPSREDLEFVCSAKSLRSLYIEDGSETIVEALPNLLRNLKYLRALYLGSRSIKEIPSEVKELKHLRYLNLRNLYLTKIMELSKLWNLETLYLTCRNETSLLGIGIEKLINLRHLCLSRYVFLPKGIGRLTSLRTLDYFRAGDETKGTAMLRELQDMNQLEGELWIRGLGKVVDVDEAVKAHLKNKKRLTGLSLNFSECRDELINNQYAVLEALEGPSELEYLGIENYKGALLLPNWIISLTNLTELILVGSETSVDLVALARLPSLEILELSLGVNIRKYNMGDEEEEEGGMSSVVARFPKLKQLLLYVLNELEESVFAAAEMPQLIRCNIHVCPKMKDLPDCILTAPQLQELTIWSCPILKEHYNKESGKYWNKISHIPKTSAGSEEISEVGRQQQHPADEIWKRKPPSNVVGTDGIGLCVTRSLGLLCTRI